MRLENKVAVVTGGGSGIGKSIALEFAKEGADLVIAGRRRTVLERSALEIEGLGRRSLYVETDISKKSAVVNLFEETAEAFGRVDILVNCASVGDVRVPIVEVSEDDWDRVMNVNLKGYFLCSQAAGKIMMANQKGNIINIASVSAIRPTSSGGIYNVSKAGEVMLTLLLAKQLARHNIRVNAIAPGMIKTDMTKEIWEDPERLARVESWIPFGHMGTPDDVAKAALFLASDDSKHMSGHTLVVDGGQLTC